MTGIKNTELSEVLNDKMYHLSKDFYIDKKIILYGAGRLGELAAILLKAGGIPVEYFVDKNYLNKTSVLGFPVYSPEKLRELDPKESIIIISAFKFPFEEMSEIIQKYSDCKIYTVYDLLFFLDEAHFSNGWSSGELSKEDKEKIEFVYNRLEDSFSKKTYLNFLRWRISRKEKNLSENDLIIEDIKYFNDQTIPALNKPGIIIDGGAFDLSFSLKAIKYNKTLNRIMAFEPDDESYDECLKMLEEMPEINGKIALYKIALSDSSGEKSFTHGHGLASRLIEGTNINEPVKTVDLDSFISNESIEEKISAVKLHIEGEELKALVGADNIIKKHKPLLMINCSHNREGLWKIPHHVMQYDGYKFFMKSHAFYGEGLTFYAVPDK